MHVVLGASFTYYAFSEHVIETWIIGLVFGLSCFIETLEFSKKRKQTKRK